MPPFISQLTIRNYKSIAACKVDLGQLMFLIGANGTGKSNFLDALRFIADGLRTSLDHALRERGTIKEVRRRSGGHPTHFAIRTNFTLPGGQSGHYAFRVGAKPQGGFEVQREECVVQPKLFGDSQFFQVVSGQLTDSSVKPMPAAVADRLFLVAASGVPEFRPVFDALSRIEIYNLNPREIAAMQKPDPGDILRRDGSNAASVLHRLAPSVRALVQDNLSRIVQGVEAIEPLTLGQLETVAFRQSSRANPRPGAFPLRRCRTARCAHSAFCSPRSRPLRQKGTRPC